MEYRTRNRSPERYHSQYDEDDDDGENDKTYEADYAYGGCWDDNVDDETNMINLMALTASDDAHGSAVINGVRRNTGFYHSDCNEQRNYNMASANMDHEYTKCMREMEDDLVENEQDNSETEFVSETDPRVWQLMLQALFDHPCAVCKGTNVDHSDRFLWCCLNPKCGHLWGFDDHTDLKRLLRDHYRMEPCRVCGNFDIYKFQAVPEQENNQRMKVLCCVCQTEHGTEGYVENEEDTFAACGSDKCRSRESSKSRMFSTASYFASKAVGSRPDNVSNGRRHWDVVRSKVRTPSASGWTSHPVVQDCLNNVKGAVSGSAQRLMTSGTNLMTRSLSNLSTSGELQQSAIALLRDEAHTVAPGIGLALGTAAGTLLFKSPVAGQVCGLAGQNIGKLIANGIAAYCSGTNYCSGANNKHEP